MVGSSRRLRMVRVGVIRDGDMLLTSCLSEMGYPCILFTRS